MLIYMTAIIGVEYRVFCLKYDYESAHLIIRENCLV